jgi:hypothetical protein
MLLEEHKEVMRSRREVGELLEIDNSDDYGMQVAW